jgi:hypothetical protein
MVVDFDKLLDYDSLSDEQGELRVQASGALSFGTSSEGAFESLSSDFSEDADLVAFEKRSGARSKAAHASRFRMQGRMFACLRREQL